MSLQIRCVESLCLLVPGFLGIGLLFLVISGCEKTGEEVLDPSKAVPYQTHAVISPDSVDTDTIFVGPQQLPDDMLPIRISAESYFDIQAPPKSVHVSVNSADGSSSLASGEMSVSDPVDPTWGQKYVGSLTVTIRRTLIGQLQVEVVGSSEEGSTSNAYRLPLSIVRLNQPPVLSNVVAPDTVALGTTPQLLLLKVDVYDPNGRDDIRSVFFNSTRPNGTPSSGNPFAMYDNETNGDEQAGDGTYTLEVVLPPTTTPGTWRFEFEAVDKSGAASATIVHLITVKP